MVKTFIFIPIDMKSCCALHRDAFRQMRDSLKVPMCVQISISHVRDTPALWISCVKITFNISVLTKLFLMLSYRECLAVLSISAWRSVKGHVADGCESGWSHDCHNSLFTLCLFACRLSLLSITSIKDDHLF